MSENVNAKQDPSNDPAQPVSRKTKANGQNAVMAAKSTHHAASACPRKNSMDRVMVWPRMGPNKWLNKNIRTACSVSGDCFRCAGTNQSTNALNRSTRCLNRCSSVIMRSC